MTKKKIALNRDQIKFIAVVLMTFNHIAHILLPSGTVVYEVFEDIGYFTAITMCFFLVEGYGYTRSKRQYIKRLLVFALISGIPYILAMGFFQLDVLFTLLICFLILCILDKSWAKWKKVLLTVLLTLSTVFCDWAIALPLAAILFWKARGDRQKQATAYFLIFLLFWALNVPGYAPRSAAYPFLSGYALLHGFFAALPLLFSGCTVLYFYNGKKSEDHAAFHKWFFYIYYPAHLLILWGIKVLFL